MIQSAPPQPGRNQVFDYTAVNLEGKVVRGMMEAADPDSVWNAISVRGLRPTAVKARSRWPLSEFLDQLTKVRLQEVAVFCRQLSTFVRVGIPLTTALETIAEGAANKRMRRACASMVGDLERGGLLSAALSRQAAASPMSQERRRRELLDALEGPVETLNAKLRGVFSRVVPDHRDGNLHFTFLDGSEGPLGVVFAWPKAV